VKVRSGVMNEKLKTRVFDLYLGRYSSLTELAQAMGMHQSAVCRVRRGERGINAVFIVGAFKAFPGYRFDDLFYLAPDGSQQELSGHRPMAEMRKGSSGQPRAKPSQQKPDLSSKVMLTTRDVAQILKVHPNTVRRWTKKAILKAYRISSRGDMRFWREDVDVLLKKREIK
jgi:excisionase family DNA binding protein